MTDTRPDVSVVMPTYNRRCLLPRSVESVLGQTKRNIELVVVDGGSTDGTVEWLEKVRDPRLRWIRREGENAVEARNSGAQEAAGRILTFLDSDDEVQPRWLECISAGFSLGWVDVVCCGLNTVHGKPGLGSQREMLPRRHGPMFGDARGLFSRAGVYALRRELFDEVGGFSGALESGEHTELALRLFDKAVEDRPVTLSLAEPLVTVYGGAPDRLSDDWAARAEGARLILEWHPHLLAREPEELAGYTTMVGVHLARSGRHCAASHELLRAAKAQPKQPKRWFRVAVALSGFGPRVWR